MHVRKLTAALAAVPLLLASSVGIAMADDIANNLDATVDAVAEVMPLNVGGSNGTTQLYVNPTGGDGKPGCNLTGSTTLTLSVASTNTAVATVSPSSVTFDSCGSSRTLTVTPVAQGSATVSVTQTSNNTGATFDLAPATFTVNVAAAAPANTAPTVVVTGVQGGATYNKGAVPSATCEVRDAEDGNKTLAATLSAVTGTYASDGIGSQTASCSYEDAGGLTVSASETYSIVDPTAPVIAYTTSPTAPDGANGWYKSNVTVNWTVTEPESPNSLSKVGCVDQNINQDQTATTYTCSATSAGGAAGEQSVSIKRDATLPSVSLIGGPEADAKYYFGSVPETPTCSASDTLPGSGLDGTCSVSGYSNAVGSHTVTATATDNAGNTATATRSYTVLAWTAKGFYSPVDMSGVWNSVKGGSTVPLKFELFAGSTELTSTSAVKSFAVKAVTCPNASAPVDEIELVTTGGTSLRYDTTGGQFIQNWQTPKKPGACYSVTMTAQDGSAISANFLLK